MKESFNIFTEELAKWEGYEVYAEKFKNLLPNFFVRGAQIYNQSNSSGMIKVLNHGDFHYNNMLMRLDENRSSLQDILLVRFGKDRRNRYHSSFHVTGRLHAQLLR